MRSQATCQQNGRDFPVQVQASVEQIARAGGTPLVVAEKSRGALGVIELKDIVKGGMRERFDQLRAMGIRTVMITGDNPLTAAAIAREAGRGRLPGAGHAERQDGPDQARAGRAASWWP